jgi:iron complex outermembrane receptor protein
MPNHRLLPFAIGLAVLPAGAYAQSDNSSAVLEEIVVTAERREASLQSVPVPVTAITAEALTNKQVTEARDLARFAPSLKMFNNITTPTNLSPSLRGSLQQDASLVVAESPFGIYVDDVYIARLNGNNITLADIERVEVLRGPQGTLYGRNTLAGAIKFVSRSPGEESWRDISVGAGNFDQQRISLSTGGKLGEGWGGSFSALYNNKGAQFYNRNPSKADDVGQETSWATRAKIRYTGTENLEITGSLSLANSTNDGGQLIPASTPSVPATRQFTSDDLVPQFGQYVLNTPNGPRANGLKNYPEGETKQTIGSLNIAYDFGAATLRSITGYVKTDDYFTNDFSGNGNVMAANKAEAEQWSEEIQILGSTDRLNYLVGAYFFDEDGTQNFNWNSYFGAPGSPAFPISFSTIKANTKSTSLFAQLDYKATDALKVTAGVRYTEDKKTFRLNWTSLLGAPAALINLKNSYSEMTPRIGLDYTLPASGNVDSMLLYFSAASGFKSGGYNGIAIFNPNDAKAPYFPEKNWTYEAGIKTDLLGNRLRINANYFLAKADDLALNATVANADGTVAFPVQNSGKATIQGLEAEITAVPADGLTMFLSGTFAMGGKYDSLNPTSSPAQSLKNFGVNPVVPQTPSFSFTVGFDYGVDNAYGRTTFGADWFTTDDYITSANNDFKVKGYSTGNAFVSHAFNDNWSARVSVKNFTDEYVITTGSRGFLGGFIPLRPREYMFSVNYKMN